GLRSASRDEGFADQNEVGSGVGVLRDLPGPGDTRFGHEGGPGRDESGQGLEPVGVDAEVFEVAGVDADEFGTDVGGELQFFPDVGLDERRHAQLPGESVELAQLHRIEGGDDEQDDVGPVRPGLVELVLVDHEVLAQDRDVHGGAYGVEVVEAAGEAAGFGEHAHGSGT